MAGYPGMDGGGADPLLGGDPILSGPEAGMHFISQMMSSVTGQQSDALYAGQLEDMAATFIEGFLTQVVTGAMMQMNQSAEWRPVVAGISDLISEMGVPGAASTGRTATPSAPHAPEIMPPAPSTTPNAKHAGDPDPVKEAKDAADEAAKAAHREQAYDPRAAFKEGRDRGGKMTMGSIAKAAAAPLAKRVSSTEREWVPVATADGRKAYRFIDNLTGQTVADEMTGVPYEDIVEGEEGYDSLARKVTRGAAIRSVATGVLSGAPIAGSVGALAAKVAGPVGLAYGAAQAGSGWLEAQQKASEPFKQVYGEETSTFAARERFDMWKEGLKGFGTIGAGEARAQYMAATQMGLKGENRDQATDFSRDMQRRFGMSTGDSMGIVSSALSQGGGVAALDDFATAITNVSRAAVDAGRTSSEAIGQFVAAQSVLARMTPGAQASTQLAGGITEMAMEMPKSLSEALGGASGMAEGMLSQQNVMAMAAMSGQSPTAALFNMSDPGTAFAQGAMTLESVAGLIVRQAANFLGMSETQFKARLNEETGGEKVSDEEQFAIIKMIAGPERGGQLLMMLGQMASTFMGKAVPPAELINLLFEASAGSFTVKAPTSTGADGPASGADRQGVDENMAYGKVDSGDSRGLADLKMDLLANTGRGSDGKPKPGTRGSVTSAMDQGDGFDAYLDYVAKTGEGDSVLEGLLNPGNKDDILKAAGVENLDDVKYKVDGKSMTLAEAIKAGYGDDLGGASISNVDKPSEQPTSVSVILDLSPDAKELVRDPGPTDDQRAGIPPSRVSPTNGYRAGR